jgi:hypothetical protein
MAKPVGHSYRSWAAPMGSPDLTPYQQAQNEWQKELWDACGAAIGRWLEERGNLHQPIASLCSDELVGIAWAVVAEYTDRREAKRKELGAQLDVFPGEPDPLDEILDL